MGERTRQPLHFGMGLDRVSGVMTVDPTSFHDLRNVHLLAGKTEYRKGLTRQLLLPAPWTDLLGVYMIRANGLAGAVVFDAVSKVVGLFVIDGTGTSATYVSPMWTMPTATPPRITATDQYGTLLIAHDEAQYGLRQQTMVYDSNASTLGPLMLDLGRTGTPEAVKFRGVAKHLAYMLGWGYGTNQPGQSDRGEVLRISLPGEPTNFVPEHYFLVGTQGDPIIGGGVGGDAFIVQKIMSSFRLVGSDRASFGVGPLDRAHGLVSPRAGVSVNAEWFFWSVAGPRSSTGGATSNLGLPLDLQGTSPDALALAASAEDGFAFYDPLAAEIVFVFGQWGYVLHLADGDRRWSYRPYAVPLTNAGLLYIGGDAGLVIGAHPEFANLYQQEASYIAGDGNPKIVVEATAVGGSITSERLEVWVKPQYTGAIWERKVNVLAGAGIQTFKVDGWWTNYDVAMRYVSGGLAAAGYTSANPATWPAISRSVVMTQGTIAGYNLGKWRRLSSISQGFNVTTKQVPGDNFAVTAALGQVVVPYTFRLECDFNLSGTFTLLQSGISYAALDTALRFLNSDSLKLADVRVRVEGPAGNSAWWLHATRTVAPEPPSNYTHYVTTSDYINDHDDTHTMRWDAPLAVNGEVPADGPYDIRARHYDNYSSPAPNFGAYGAMLTPGVGDHEEEVAAPGYASSSSTSRTAGIELRTNRGSGDVSPWLLYNFFEP